MVVRRGSMITFIWLVVALITGYLYGVYKGRLAGYIEGVEDCRRVANETFERKIREG